MFAHRKYTLVVADANNDDADSSPSMTPCPSPAPPPSVRSPGLLLNRRRLPRPPPPPPANGDPTGLPPVLFSSLSASILQDRRQATAETAIGAAAAAGPLSSASSLVLQDRLAAANERAALERTVRQRISGRQRHPAGDRSGVADRDSTPPLMQPLVVDPAALLEEDRFLEAAVPGSGNGGEEVAVPGGGNCGDVAAAAPLRPWCQVRGNRRLGQRLEVMSRAAAERRPKGAVDGGSPLVQGLKDFFSKMFAGR
jgi:hypothetical protein